MSEHELEMRLKAFSLAVTAFPNDPEWLHWRRANAILEYVYNTKPMPEKPDFKPFSIQTPPTKWQRFISNLKGKNK